MNKKPLFFNLMSFMFFSLSIGFPIQIMLMNGYGPDHWGSIFSKMSSLNWLLVVLFFGLSLLTYYVNQTVIYLLPVSRYQL
jgi:hypothetical protein